MSQSESESSPAGFQRTAILNVVGLSSRHVGPDTPHISEFRERENHKLAHVEPQIPAVTSTMQATYLTGKTPADHGIVGNLWYDREYAEHRAWKQSDHLVGGRKLWEHLQEDDPDFTCARLFWWNNMYSSVDYSATPRPIYCADGKKVFDFQTHPMELHRKLRRKIGKFPFQTFWGPKSGIESSHWIARAAKWFEEQFSPKLNLVYLPHLDYNLQRLGPNDPLISMDLGQIDAVVGDLIRFYEKRDVRVILLSEYGITEVDNPIHINRIFREKGWLTLRTELRKEVLDLGNSKAFAIPDHQVAHIYVNDPSILEEVRETVAEIDGVSEVIDGSMRNYFGMEHPRAGDLVAVSNIRSWFTYYFWEKDRKAPDYARTVDIHRKPGYDPVELFVNPKIKFPRLKVANKLIRKKLGFRTLMNIIPLDASLVKGSHGAIPELHENWPVLIGDLPDLPRDEAKIQATDVYRHLHGVCSRSSE
ncbi:MAG: alkaline phosphatase family protein [Verrucomicrobiales bacterium]|nr:alkaline phosphatase family protein [Verrucomicrobiales bacterium]